MKSVYKKYIVSFVVLLAIGFTSIGLITSSLITNFSIDKKREIMTESAQSVKETLRIYLNDGKSDLKKGIKANSSQLKENFISLCRLSECVILVCDYNGVVVLEVGDESREISRTKIKANTARQMATSPEKFNYSNLDGYFDSNRYNAIAPIVFEKEDNSSPEGFVIFTTSVAGIRGVQEKIILTLAVSCLWIFALAIVAIHFITDRTITPLKQMSEAAKSYSKGDFSPRIEVRGDDEISDLARAMNQMASELDAFEKSRSTFFSNVSHDLRTPMTSIQGFIDGILDGTIPPEKQSYYLKIVSDEVKRLSRLVNSLLDISRMESGKIKINKSNFDVCEIARLILISFEEKIDAKKIEIEFDAHDDPSNVFADKDAIYQIIYNLVDNAIKFTNDGGTLRISVIPQGDKYNVTVFNTGIGINKNELEAVFDRFYKSDFSRSLDKTGTGLGLYIVKSKLEAHGESIKVESEFGKNCAFTFTLTKAQKR